MSDTIPEFIEGQFLIAMPSLEDPFFSKSVTLMCEHKTEGAFGIIINQALPDFDPKLFFKELNLECRGDGNLKTIHIGGPVQRNNIFVIHGPPFHWLSTYKVTETIALSNTMDILEGIASGYGPQDYLIAAGYAGWGAGQLESEMQRNSWLTCPLDEDLLFRVSVEDRWEAAIRLLGIDPKLLLDNAGHA